MGMESERKEACILSREIMEVNQATKNIYLVWESHGCLFEQMLMELVVKFIPLMKRVTISIIIIAETCQDFSTPHGSQSLPGFL